MNQGFTFSITLILSLLLLTVASCKKTKTLNQNQLEKGISEYVAKNCHPDHPCTIKLDQLTPFAWDKFYYFEMLVENEQVSKVLGFRVSSDMAYSRKWFFIDGDHLANAHFRSIPEIDKPVGPGEVIFDIHKSQNNYAVFVPGSVFSIDRSKIDDGEFFILTCINCELPDIHN